MTTAEIVETNVLGTYARAPLTLVRGQGVRVWDENGTEFRDFTTGIAVNTLGHAHPYYTRKLQEQAEKLVHTSNLFTNTEQARLAERLVQRAGPGRIVFGNSGAEANEFLIKLGRLYGTQTSGGEGRRYRILTALNSFHGRTYGGMSATPQAKVQAGFGPLVPGFAHAPLNDLAAFAALVDDQTIAILVESIQGEGGIHSCTPGFLQGLRQLCDERGLLLLVDEVQCGIGRTGAFFAFEASGITADAIGMAKGLGGGFPIGACWVAEKHIKLFKPGMHGSTYAGSPLACAAANAVLDVLEQEDLIGHVNALAPGFRNQLDALVARYPQVLSGVRGRGFLIGLGLRAPYEAAAVIAALRAEGLLCPAAGTQTVRLLPPLNVTAEELDDAAQRIDRALAKLAAPAGAAGI